MAVAKYRSTVNIQCDISVDKIDYSENPFNLTSKKVKIKPAGSLDVLLF
jgi:hypothetical protein